MTLKENGIAFVLMALLTTVGCASHSTPTRTISNVFEFDQSHTAAPFGDRVSENIFNYSRVSPNIGIAGILNEAGVREAQELGFALIIDLRQPTEDGVDMEKRVTTELDLPYRNIPFSRDETVWDDVDEIASLLKDKANYPVLIHCGSANRAGAFWALYRAKDKVEPIIAIEEGRAVGLTSREKQVRNLLGLPTSDNED